MHSSRRIDLGVAVMSGCQHRPISSFHSETGVEMERI